MQPNDFVYYIATPAKNLEDGCSFIGPYDTEQQRDNEVKQLQAAANAERIRASKLFMVSYYRANILREVEESVVGSISIAEAA